MEEIQRFSFLNEQILAYEFFHENGCVIFKDLVEPDYVKTLKSQLKDLIYQQYVKHMKIPFDSNKILSGNDFDRGLIEFAKSNDVLRERLYNVVQGLTSLLKLSTNPNFSTITQSLGIKIPIHVKPQIRIDLPNDERFLIPPHQDIR